MAMRETKGIFKTTVYGAITNILLNALLIPLFGMNGASIATCISYAITFWIRNRDTRKFVKLTYKVKYNIVCVSLIMLQIILLFICKSMVSIIAVEGILFFVIFILSLYSYKDLMIRLFSKIRTQIKEVRCMRITNYIRQDFIQLKHMEDQQSVLIICAR